MNPDDLIPPTKSPPTSNNPSLISSSFSHPNRFSNVGVSPVEPISSLPSLSPPLTTQFPSGSFLVDSKDNVMGFSEPSSSSLGIENFPFIKPEIFEFKASTDEKKTSISTEKKMDKGFLASGSFGDEVESVGVVPQPLECLQGNPVPPFLNKTFDIVDDPSLDPIVSWSASGESFVVWDPVEFARLVLPQNFKHNNFSSFVRQLNTYGFRKIDTDRWEFANEAFQQGKRHLLRSIQRRRSPQSLQIGSQVGPCRETRRSGVEGEIERLKREKSLLMQEVVELQQQHKGTVCHMEIVNQRLKEAEERQTQMVSFLAKVLQNPEFLARLRQQKEKRDIGSPRTKRKFVKHQTPETVASSSQLEGQIVRYRPESKNLSFGFEIPESPVELEQFPDSLLEDMVGKLGLGVESIPFPMDDAGKDELEIALELIKTPEHVGEGSSSLEIKDNKRKDVVIHQLGVTTEYFVSFPDDSAREKTLYLSDLAVEKNDKMEKKEDLLWSTGFDASGGTSASSYDLWGTLMTYETPQLEVTGGFPNIWDLDPLQSAGSSGIDKWPGAESPFDELQSQAGLPKYDIPKNTDT
ncbi:Heat shock factor (HSF)-type, DNA-binding [Dillenia turbinata]|uniref:Heat shock factor (HSF)-type, DNA-binding n=1 Tax=Dillenia turbinata TaxID=194707 RepID=A0AAN8W9X7_9MAGN